MNSDAGYHDFLGLSGRVIDECQAVVFTGISGSGKTRAMEYLAAHNPVISRHMPCLISGDPLPWLSSYDSEWLLVDEIVHVRDLLQVRQLLARGHRLVLANHLPTMLVRLLLVGYHVKYFSTDSQSNKLAIYLQSRQIDYSDESLQQYISQYGQSYNSLAVILEHTGAADLALALARFNQHCRMAVSRS